MWFLDCRNNYCPNRCKNVSLTFYRGFKIFFDIIREPKKKKKISSMGEKKKKKEMHR